MKFDFVSICKSIIKKWYILLVAMVVGCSVGLIIVRQQDEKNVYVSQIFIEQNFIEKTSPDSNYYSNFFTEKNNQLMNNALVALNNASYLEKQFKSVELSYKDNLSIVSFLRLYETNMIQIRVEYQDDEVAKALCGAISKNSWAQINKIILNNIDEETGEYKEGTTEAQKISVREILAPTYQQPSSLSQISTIVIYGVVFVVVAILGLFVYYVFNKKFKSIDDIKFRYGLKTTAHSSIKQEIEESFVNIAICQNKKKCLFISNKITLQDIVGFCNEFLNEYKVLIVGEPYEKSKGLKNGEVRFIKAQTPYLVLEELDEALKNEEDFDYVFILKKGERVSNQGPLYYQNADIIIIDISLNYDRKDCIDKIIFELSDEEKEKTVVCTVK